jgi:hypothetical protein
VEWRGGSLHCGKFISSTAMFGVSRVILVYFPMGQTRFAWCSPRTVAPASALRGFPSSDIVDHAEDVIEQIVRHRGFNQATGPFVRARANLTTISPLAVLAISGAYIHRDDQAVLDRHSAAVAMQADKLGVDLADWFGIG